MAKNLTPQQIEERKQRNREYNRARYARLKASGLCTHCGEPSGGASRCENCALTVTGFWQKRQARGECPKCRKPHTGKYFLCFECRKKGVAERAASKQEFMQIVDQGYKALGIELKTDAQLANERQSLENAVADVHFSSAPSKCAVSK